MSLRLSQPSPSFLIVNLRLAGDVLLSTALALSIKQHYPGAVVDYLVYTGTEKVLAKNPHIRSVYTVGSGKTGLGIFRQLWKRYDVSIGTNASDRTALFCAGSARYSISFVLPGGKFWWKRLLLSDPQPYDSSQHTVAVMLGLLKPLRIAPIARVVMAFDAADQAFVDQRLGDSNFVLLHPFTRHPYKYWPAAAWAKLAALIRSETGLRPVFSRGIGATDDEQLADIMKAVGGQMECFPEPFTLNQLAAAIRKSRIFVGVDTLGTHVAAAVGVPIVALFGPTPADSWGPWPNDHPSLRPYAHKGGIQRQGCFTILQPDWPCVPCHKETCAITQRGKMECLEQLSPEAVLSEIKARLASSNDQKAGLESLGQTFRPLR